MIKNKNSLGFSVVEMLLILVVVGMLGFTGWFVYHSKMAADKEYKASNNSATSQKQEKVSQKDLDPYEGWKDYSNDTYGFSFKYPSDWKVSESVHQLSEVESPTKQLLAVSFAPAESIHDFMNVRVEDITLADLQTNEFYSKGAAGAISDITSGTSITLGSYQGLKFNTYGQTDTAYYFYEVKGKLILFEDNFGNGYHGTEAKLILDSLKIK